MGFFVSLIPLTLLVWQSARLQSQLSESWIRFSDDSMLFVQSAVGMDGVLTDIERSVKQYEVLQGAAMARLAQQQIDRYLGLVDSVCLSALNAAADLCHGQSSDVLALAEAFQSSGADENDRLLKKINERQDRLMEFLWQEVGERKARQIEQGEQKQRLLNAWTVALAVVTLLLVLLASRNVSRPVKLLENRIHHIGQKYSTEATPASEFSGPREFLTINQRLDWLSNRLNQLEDLRQSFLRHASHELKTPLSSIIESSALLKEGILGQLSPAQDEVVDILVDSGHRLSHLTERLLDYNYLVQVQKLQLKQFNVSELLTSLLEQYQPLFDKRHQEVKFECELTELRTDEALFSRLADNLMSNAQAYGHSNGQVLIQLIQVGRYWQLTVANTGPSITEEQIQYLFEPFYRTEHPRYGSLKGSGLGLSIVRDCVSLLGGQVQFTDLPGYDFSISVTVPIDDTLRDT
ncbi:putative sensor kinase protein [Reinekea sp. MED297]|uniref:histidine kinase n=1 Tax=Reinekea blandensis MED297 TaxID=314283 RepID=A4BIZ5_9GAMM|nr:putative sensor kinase protein [Reinekea sp. MED297] [Reinekea blandensis MED297]